MADLFFFASVVLLGAELEQMLRELRFRPEVISLANFGETYLPHLDVRNWARQLAFGVYRQTAR